MVGKADAAVAIPRSENIFLTRDYFIHVAVQVGLRVRDTPRTLN